MKDHLRVALYELMDASQRGKELQTLYLGRLIEYLPDFHHEKLYKAIVKRNGKMVNFNPVLTALRGCNTAIYYISAGSAAKTTMFYLLKYLTKDPTTRACTASIAKSCHDDITAYPSLAADTGTDERTARHWLNRIMNKFNGYGEYSGMLICACLLGAVAEPISHKAHTFSLKSTLAAQHNGKNQAHVDKDDCAFFEELELEVEEQQRRDAGVAPDNAEAANSDVDDFDDKDDKAKIVIPAVSLASCDFEVADATTLKLAPAAFSGSPDEWRAWNAIKKAAAAQEKKINEAETAKQQAAVNLAGRQLKLSHGHEGSDSCGGSVQPQFIADASEPSFVYHEQAFPWRPDAYLHMTPYEFFCSTHIVLKKKSSATGNDIEPKEEKIPEEGIEEEEEEEDYGEGAKIAKKKRRPKTLKNDFPEGCPFRLTHELKPRAKMVIGKLHPSPPA